MSLKENKLNNYIYELLLGEVHGFIGKFYQTFKYKNVKLNKLFQKIEEKGTFHNFFYEVNITLIQKQKMNESTRKLQINITNKFRCQNLQLKH